MAQELAALEANGTWPLQPLAPDKKPIGSRLVAKGYSQVEGLDYGETFALVAKLVTVRLLFAVASTRHWHLYQLDVNNAFLNNDLDENVYMNLLPGFRQKWETRVCKLHKSLYGLKKASRQWFIKISIALKQAGYHQLKAYYSLFVRTRGSTFSALLIYQRSFSQHKYALEILEDAGQLGAKPADSPWSRICPLANMRAITLMIHLHIEGL
ncbi:unnamed protein product [Prunus brigantina]